MNITGMNSMLHEYVTVYWDKRRIQYYPDQTKGTSTRWNISSNPQLLGVVPVKFSEKKPLENKVRYQYPGQGQGYVMGSHAQPSVIGRVLDDGTSQIYRYEYNPKGKVTRYTDPVGRATTYTYESNGMDLLETRQVSGQSTDLLETRTYNSQHRPLTVTDAAGQTTTYTYNTQGQLLTGVTPPRAGLSLAQRTTTYGYDTNGYLQGVTGPLPGTTIAYTYDGYGRIRTITDPEGYSLTYDYDALSRTTKVTYPDGSYDQTVYNRLDREQQRDRLGRWSQTFYDALRRVVSKRDPANRTITQQWCSCGSLDKIIDAKNNTTTWERDIQGRVTKEIRADGNFQTFSYEMTTSRLKTRTDAKGQLTTYNYFGDNRTSQIEYANAAVSTPSISFVYDPVYDRPSSMTDGVGTTNYVYYPVTVPPTLGAGMAQAIDGPLANDTVSYSYDELGRITARGLSTFLTTTGYDALDRIMSLASPLGSFAWAYVNTTTRPQTATYPNGQVTAYSYFNTVGDHRLQQIKHQQTGGGAVLSQFDYTYDAVGNISTWRQQLGASAAKIYSFGYDAADQLSSAVQKDASTQQIIKNYGYAYDPAGNRTVDAQDSMATTSQYNNRNQLIQQAGGAALPVAGVLSEPATVSVAGTPASVSAANQFTGGAQVGTGTQNFTVLATDPSGNTRTNTYQVNVSGTAQSLVYDANGNLCARDGTTCTNGSTIYEWDAENRLVNVKQGSTTLASFAYDGKGKRVQKVAGGITSSYIYDEQNLVQERLSSGQSYDYVQSAEVDRPLARRDQTGVVSYYLADHLGSIAQTTNSAGAVTLTREYDPWGNLLQGSTTGGYAFTGREWDPEAGLHYYRARYFDSTVARFISEDPLGPAGGTNRYAYVTNSPLRYLDPFGLSRTGLPPQNPPCTPKFPPCYPGSCVLDLGYGSCAVIVVSADCKHTISSPWPCYSLSLIMFDPPKTSCTENWWRSHTRQDPPDNTLPPDPPAPPNPPGVSPPNCPDSGPECPS
jgi:RHS repeat-associated protein